VENEACDTARPQWFMLAVRAKQERKVAEVFLPMHTVRQQWSDRLKTYDARHFYSGTDTRDFGLLAQ
jgi:hypothetical protein